MAIYKLILFKKNYKFARIPSSVFFFGKGLVQMADERPALDGADTATVSFSQAAKDNAGDNAVLQKEGAVQPPTTVLSVETMSFKDFESYHVNIRGLTRVPLSDVARITKSHQLDVLEVMLPPKSSSLSEIMKAVPLAQDRKAITGIEIGRAHV